MQIRPKASKNRVVVLAIVGTAVAAMHGYVASADAPLVSIQESGDCKECRAVLKDGVFNTTNISRTTSSKRAFERWLCTTEFQTHDDAVSAGISIGVPVYDVPVEIGGSFSNDQRSAWKKSHCQSTASSADEFSTLSIALREAAPEILKAWTACIENTCGAARTALLCKTEPAPGGTLFRARWNRGVGDNAEPRIRFFQAFDAACTPGLKQNGRIPEAGVALRCSVAAGKTAQFVLQTDRGTCTPTGGPQSATETIAGTIELDRVRHIKADRLVFKDGSVIVTNGHRLVLEAQEFVFEGSPRIVSFSPMGSGGRSAAEIVVRGERVSGTSLLIDNVGEPGAQGAPGASGAKGPRGGKGTPRDWNAINGCIGGSNGGSGGVGGDGGAGGTGGAGGNGGSVILDLGFGLNEGAIARLVIKTDGGAGGAGGDAGAAGPGGDGGEGANGTTFCGGTGPGAPGPAGRPGQRGASGANGVRGAIVFLR